MGGRLSIVNFMDSQASALDMQKMLRAGNEKRKFISGPFYLRVALLVGSAVLIGAGSWIYHRAALTAQGRAAEAAAAAYIAAAHKSERGFIESLPIYQDYATPAREQKLRTHLLADHLAAANRFGVPSVADEASIQKLAGSGDLVKVENTPETGYYFYNVPKRFRYLTPAAASGLNAIAERLQRVLAEKDRVRRARSGSKEEGNGQTFVAPPVVKFAISSMLRPASYQAQLRGRNANASLVSSHSQGVSFDIFYDEYYVQLSNPAEAYAAHQMTGTDAAVQETMRSRLGFLLGAALRRQFRAVLTETLLQLQDEGLVYVILEKRQRCYHVTVLR